MKKVEKNRKKVLTFGLEFGIIIERANEGAQLEP
jgi:hypothetical protein